MKNYRLLCGPTARLLGCQRGLLFLILFMVPLLPIEIELPSLRLAVTSDVPMDSLYYAETRLAELEALDKRRMNALQHLEK